MGIEVGEYVRTSKGRIFKYSKGRAYLGKDNKITKHSKNIIDLIEVGDFVNGYYVTDKYFFAGEKLVLETEGNDTNCKCLCNEDIKTILTKEQYNQNCYRVEE